MRDWSKVLGVRFKVEKRGAEIGKIPGFGILPFKSFRITPFTLIVPILHSFKITIAGGQPGAIINNLRRISEMHRPTRDESETTCPANE
ncbi:MAG: hypothetical protein H7070_01145 [Saprospiraceae bacterium]|nr:hypothetical protein [Pyrinomonadaceae bacterium]